MRRANYPALAASFLVGLGVGAWLMRSQQVIELLDLLVRALVDLLAQHGLAVAIAVFLVGFVVVLTWKSIHWVVSSKDQEILRLVEEKKELQVRLIGEAPSSTRGRQTATGTQQRGPER